MTLSRDLLKRGFYELWSEREDYDAQKTLAEALHGTAKALYERVDELEARLNEEVLELVRQSVYSAPQINMAIADIARVMAGALAQTEDDQ